MISASAIEQSATVECVVNKTCYIAQRQAKHLVKTVEMFRLKKRDYDLLFKRTPSIIDTNCLLAISNPDPALLLNFDVNVIDFYQIWQYAHKLY